MLGDPNDPLALEHEPREVQDLLQKYLDGDIELEEAERRIDYDLYVGEEGAAHRKEDEALIEGHEREMDRLRREHARLKRWIDADCERIRIRHKAKLGRPTAADHIARVAATLPHAQD